MKAFSLAKIKISVLFLELSCSRVETRRISNVSGHFDKISQKPHKGIYFIRFYLFLSMSFV